MTTPKDIIERADMTLQDLTANGGLLNPEQSSQFISFIYQAPTILNLCRQVTMKSYSTKIPKIGFGSRILQPSPGSGTEMPSNQRVKPTTSQAQIDTVEVVADVRLPYDVLEDNIEQQNLEQTIMQHIATQTAIDLEELAIQGDTTSADPYLALQDGWLKRMNLNIVDAQYASISDDVFENTIQTVDPRYRRQMNAFKFLTHDKISRRWTRLVADRGTILGDQMLINGGTVPYSGVPVLPVDLMAEVAAVNSNPSASSVLFTNPLNLIFGVWRQIRLEVEKIARQREYAIIASLRVGVQIEEVKAGAKAINVSTANS